MAKRDQYLPGPVTGSDTGFTHKLTTAKHVVTRCQHGIPYIHVKTGHGLAPWCNHLLTHGPSSGPIISRTLSGGGPFGTWV